MSHIEVKETMSFVLEGGDELDIDTFSSILISTSKILKKTTQYSVDGEYQKFAISDVKKGSFIVELCAILPMVPTIVSTSHTALKMFKSILDLKTQLSGGEVKDLIREDNSVTIETNDGTVNIYNINTFNAYTEDTDIDDNISQMMKNIYNDSNITGFKLNHSNAEGDQVFEYSPEKLSHKTDLTALNNQLVTEKNRVQIKLSKVTFEGNSQWQGWVGANKQYFSLIDEEFKGKLHEYSFTSGTILDCDLQITYKAYANGLPVENAKFKSVVTKVYDVINPTSQSQESFLNN